VQKQTAFVQKIAPYFYILATMLLVFIGALAKSDIVWKSMDILLILVAIPNLVGILMLACREPESLEI
jgi:Na+/alanine symporter